MPSSNTLSVICESLNAETGSAEKLLKSSDEPANFAVLNSRNNSTRSNNNNNNNIVSPAENRIGGNNRAEVTKNNQNNNKADDIPILSHESAIKHLQYYFHLIASYVDMERVRDLVLLLILSVYGMLYGLVLSLIPRKFLAKDVSGQIVLITGAGSGIGRLMAKKFAIQHGAIVVVWDINQQGMEETVKEIRAAGGKAHGYIVDVTKREKIYEAADKVKAEVGKVDILINNAGIVSGSRFLETSDEKIDMTMQVNSMANFWTCKAFLPEMLRTSRGHVVTIASSAGIVGVNRLVDYCASKYAAVGFHEALLSEIKADMGEKNVHCTLVCPYYINTGMFDGVKSKLLPILEPVDVVEDITTGILANQETIVIPRYVLYLVLFKYFVPAQIGFKLLKLLGITGTMLTFKGRGNVVAEAQKTK